VTDSRDPGAPTGRTVHALGPTGEIRDWLVSPAWSGPCDDLDDVLAADGTPWGEDGRWALTNGPDSTPLKQRLHALHPLVTDQPLPTPVEGEPLRWIAPVGARLDQGTWSREHTGEDGLLDWSRFCFVPEYRHAIAAVQLEVDQAEWRTFELASTGPLAAWVGDDLVATTDTVSYMEPLAHRLSVRLRSGTTRLLIATWQVAFREVRHVARVRVHGLPVRVVLPSPGADEYATATGEQVLADVGVRSWALVDGIARLHGPDGAALTVAIGDGAARRLRLSGGVAELDLVHDRASDPTGSDTASMLDSGETQLTVRVDDERSATYRRLQVAVLPADHRGEPARDEPEVWRRELLEHVAAGAPGTARALARCALDPGSPLDAGDLRPALDMVGARADCADFEAVGLVVAWRRIPADRWPPGARERVRRALTGFKYWIDQPGLDAMCYFTENHQMVWHTAETLVGEVFEHDTFANSGWNGVQHAEHGRRLAQEWMGRKLAGGFSEFDSNAYLAIDSLALAALVDLADDPRVRGQAEALLDKLLLTLAANSWRGVHGAAHGRSYTPTLRSARFEETAPIMRLLWGTGTLNSAVLPATVLATAHRYAVPPLVRRVATALDEDWDGRQVYRGGYRDHHDLLQRPYGSDLRVWRTRSAMLSSVQDYRAGLPGLQEHVWGATLGPEVQVFATHPAASSHSASARPNAWAGQRVLPRVRQHRDTVLVLHAFPADELGATTHLWFPAPLMDEVAEVRSWLAGRVGDGYVAVATAGGFRPRGGRHRGAEEWEPRGPGSAYVATVGRSGVDTTFADFVSSLAEPAFEDAAASRRPSASWVARDGRLLTLDWDGPFIVDGSPVDLGADGRPEAPPHLSNPACQVELGAPRLEAACAGERLVLDLVEGRRLEPHTSVEVPDGG